jgi:hypothetical protein
MGGALDRRVGRGDVGSHRGGGSNLRRGLPRESRLWVRTATGTPAGWSVRRALTSYRVRGTQHPRYMAVLQHSEEDGNFTTVRAVR